MYRIVVQEGQLTPKSGRVVAYVGSFNPHSKENSLDTEKIAEYLKNGAQPSPRVVKLLVENKVKLPDWVKKTKTDAKGATRFPDKLRKNQPEESGATSDEKVEEAPAEAAPETDAPTEPTEEVPAEEKPAEVTTE
jgi:small subunit ribosomal protein S16